MIHVKLTDKLLVRNIQIQDKLGINELIDELNTTDNLSYSITDEWFKHVLKEAGGDLFVGLYQGKLIALATCMVNSIDRKQANLNIMVHPEYRKNGIGSHLYHHMISHVQKRKIQQLEAFVKERLECSIQFATNRDFHPILYSWQMDVELSDVNYNLVEHKDTIFRVASIADSRAYSEIINQCFGDVLNENSLQITLQDPSVQVYMLEKENKIVGTITSQERTKLSLGYIYDVAIATEHRGQGLGSLILKCCMNQLKANAMKHASLLVTGENKSALALYYRLRFEVVDTDIVMQKNL